MCLLVSASDILPFTRFRGKGNHLDPIFKSIPHLVSHPLHLGPEVELIVVFPIYNDIAEMPRRALGKLALKLTRTFVNLGIDKSHALSYRPAVKRHRLNVAL